MAGPVGFEHYHSLELYKGDAGEVSGRFEVYGDLDLLRVYSFHLINKVPLQITENMMGVVKGVRSSVDQHPAVLSIIVEFVLLP